MVGLVIINGERVGIRWSFALIVEAGTTLDETP
jgi:hypothetical protein